VLKTHSNLTRGGPDEDQLAPGATNRNPPDCSFFSLIREDFVTHGSSLLEPGFWIMALHRFGNLRMDVRTKVLRAPLTLLYRFLSVLMSWLWGIDIGYSTPIGRRFRIWHHGCIFIRAQSIGDDVQIRHSTSIGVQDRHNTDRAPIIEDGVDIYAGAVIAGQVVIGRGATIGANSLVMSDVPAGATVVGVPARRMPSALGKSSKTDDPGS
jgi:serine O-acetyltransferase